jgi:hypothetical protein
MQRSSSMVLNPLPEAVRPSPETQDPIPEELYDLLQSPSLFARILLIATFRDTTTDRYDSGQAARFYTPAIDAGLRALHLEIFTAWLSLSLQRQKADITIYLNFSAAHERSAKIKNLLAVAERAVPAGAKPPERQLFLQDLKIVHALFTYDH